MGVYNTFAYNDGTKYGRPSALQYSVAPFSAIATSTNSVSLTWATPGGDYLGVRLLRNQQGFSEHYEDGVALFTEYSSSSSKSSFVDEDGSQPLVSGKEAFYSIWVLLPDYTWRVIGTASCLLPRAHNEEAPDGTVLVSSANKFASLIPRTYLATGKTYLDEIDETSDLYQFLSSMSLVLDEQHTLIENLIGNTYGTASNPAIALVEASQLGVVDLPAEAMLTAKRLVRQAVGNYSKKGTQTAIQSYLSALTGYGVDISASNNLMLSMQDSTFYKGIGNWKLVPGAASTATFAAVEDAVSQSRSPWVVDTSWVGSLSVTTGTAELQLGLDTPTLTGVPVTPGISYAFSGKVKSATPITSVDVTWFDRKGVEISTETLTLLVSAETWSDTWLDFACVSTNYAPLATYDVDGNQLTEAAVFAGINWSFGESDTLIDMLSFAPYSTDGGALPDYYEARGVTAYLYPSKTNYAPNPSFELLDGGVPVGWDWSGYTGDPVIAASLIPGVNNGDVCVLNSATTRVSHQIPTGKYYTLSAYVKADTDPTAQATLSVSWDDGTTTGSVTSGAIDVTDAWTRVSKVVYIPDTVSPQDLAATITGAGLVISITSGANDLLIDCVQFEKGIYASDYFDGSMSLSNAFYSGDDPTTLTSNEDISYLYYTFGTRVNLMESTMATQVPVNRSFVITYGDVGDTTVAWGTDPVAGPQTQQRKLSLVALSGVTA